MYLFFSFFHEALEDKLETKTTKTTKTPSMVTYSIHRSTRPHRRRRTSTLSYRTYDPHTPRHSGNIEKNISYFQTKYFFRFWKCRDPIWATKWENERQFRVLPDPKIWRFWTPTVEDWCTWICTFNFDTFTMNQRRSFTTKKRTMTLSMELRMLLKSNWGPNQRCYISWFSVVNVWRKISSECFSMPKF